jgi:hypothetical protein
MHITCRCPSSGCEHEREWAYSTLADAVKTHNDIRTSHHGLSAVAAPPIQWHRDCWKGVWQAWRAYLVLCAAGTPVTVHNSDIAEAIEVRLLNWYDTVPRAPPVHGSLFDIASLARGLFHLPPQETPDALVPDALLW